jgi:hypothetical protein
MKKISKKLSLHRETLATLSPDLLEGIGGGQAVASRTVTTVTPITRPVSNAVCPSRMICPPVSLGVNCGAKGQE